MRRIFLAALISTLALRLGVPAVCAADPTAEIAAFSVIPKVDLARLAKGEIVSARSPAGVPRHLAVQSCYVVMTTPAKALDALQQWDPSRHKELKIFVHTDLPSSPKPADFSRLTGGDGRAVSSLASTSAKGGPDLQVSHEEAKKLAGKGGFSEGLRNAWDEVLANRAQLFTSGGAAKQPSYDNTGTDVTPAGEFAGLLRNQEKVRKQFSGFLGESGVSGRPGLKTELYAELIDVEDKGVLTLGAFASKPVGGGFQAADMLYYASGGYYVSLTLYQMWPVEIEGQQATLVWRGDMISSAALASLRGMEKIGSEGAMMSDIKRAITFLKRDSTR